MNDAFTIKYKGNLHYFLGIEVSQQEDGMILTQHKFTKELLLASGIKEFKQRIPLRLNTKLSASDVVLMENSTLYRSLIGKLNFLTSTRLYLTYTLQSVNQLMQNPRSPYWKTLLHTLYYVYKRCINLCVDIHIS